MGDIESIVQWAGGVSLSGLLLAVAIVLAILFGIPALVRSSERSQEAWFAIPDLDRYWSLHPDCKTTSGPKCFKCGSKSFRNVRGNGGLGGDGDRLISCRHCETTLYRIDGGIDNFIIRKVLAKHSGPKNAEDVWRLSRGRLPRK